MSAPDLTPREAARWAGRCGLSLPPDRHAPVAATAQYIHSVVAVLRELDFGEVPPAAHRVHHGEEEPLDAAV
ncbi:hypothetical protein [Streptomyces sp. NPDC006309]|uniref:hypothetical protein n=1 Tax=Streptomyces sp. NPDC006309 TaxID=3156749 RepID=UPI0033AFEB65